MNQLVESHLEAFTRCLMIVLIFGFLWLFWANLFVLITPNLDLPFVDAELSRQIEMIIFCPVIIPLGINAISSGRDASNPRLENFVMPVCFSVSLVVDPLVEIAKELSKGKDLFLILNERPDITTSLFSAIAVAILITGATLARKNKDK